LAVLEAGQRLLGEGLDFSVLGIAGGGFEALDGVLVRLHAGPGGQGLFMED
jgi:hypothetical protein